MSENGSKLKVAFLMMCHESADIVIAKLENPFWSNPQFKTYIHYDKKSGGYKDINDYCKDKPHFHLLTERIDCKWGDYSLIQSTQRLLKTAIDHTTHTADYLYLISGSCLPCLLYTSPSPRD